MVSSRRICGIGALFCLLYVLVYYARVKYLIEGNQTDSETNPVPIESQIDKCQFFRRQNFLKNCNTAVFDGITAMNELADELDFKWFITGGAAMHAARFGEFQVPLDLYDAWDKKYMEHEDKHLHAWYDSFYDYDLDFDAHIVTKNQSHFEKIKKAWVKKSGYAGKYHIHDHRDRIIVRYFWCPTDSAAWGTNFFQVLRCHVWFYLHEAHDLFYRNVLGVWNTDIREQDQAPCYIRTEFELQNAFECGDCVYSPAGVLRSLGVPKPDCLPTKMLMDNDNKIPVVSGFGHPIPVPAKLWGMAWRAEEYGSTCNEVGFPGFMQKLPGLLEGQTEAGPQSRQARLKTLLEKCERIFENEISLANKNTRFRKPFKLMGISSLDTCQSTEFPFERGVKMKMQEQCPHLFN